MQCKEEKKQIIQNERCVCSVNNLRVFCLFFSDPITQNSTIFNSLKIRYQFSRQQIILTDYRSHSQTGVFEEQSNQTYKTRSKHMFNTAYQTVTSFSACSCTAQILSLCIGTNKQVHFKPNNLTHIIITRQTLNPVLGSNFENTLRIRLEGVSERLVIHAILTFHVI